MASIQDIQISIDNELIEYIKWLKLYKSTADEVLSILTSLELKDHDSLKHAQELALRALNIGAHEEPKHLDSGWGEQDVIIRLFLKAWRQEDFETWDKLPDWVEMDNEQFRDVRHRFSFLLTETNSKPATNEY